VFKTLWIVKNTVFEATVVPNRPLARLRGNLLAGRFSHWQFAGTACSERLGNCGCQRETATG